MRFLLVDALLKRPIRTALKSFPLINRVDGHKYVQLFSNLFTNQELTFVTYYH